MCYLRVFGCFQQRFPEGIIKSYEGTILTSGKVCCVQYLLVFRLISGYTGERLIPGLRQTDWVLRALLLTVTCLWPQSGEIYSARWKLILISDQFKDLVKNCFEGGGSMSPFQPLVYIRDLGQIDCVSREKFHVTIYVEKARVLRSNLTRFRPCGSIMSVLRTCCDCRQSHLFCDLPKVLTGMWLSSCYQKTLCQA